MKVFSPTFEQWLRSPWRDALLSAAEDYIDRSGEEISVTEELTSLHYALFGSPGLLLLVGTDDTEARLLGFALCRIASGTEQTGPLAQLWQAYVVPGRALLIDLWTQAEPLILAWARSQGASRIVAISRRMRGAARSYARLGLVPYAMVMQREI
jgi:hypothetical protein